MASSKLVTCKKKHLGTEHYNHIIGIGGGSGAERWYRTEAEAMLNIEFGRESYHVMIDGKDVKVVIQELRKNRFTYRYLKSEADDGLEPASIINLPECPDAIEQ